MCLYSTFPSCKIDKQKINHFLAGPNLHSNGCNVPLNVLGYKKNRKCAKLCLLKHPN